MMTMWRPNEPVEEAVSDLPGVICRANTADHTVTLGVMGLLIKLSSGISKIFDPTEHSSAPSLAVLILDL